MSMAVHDHHRAYHELCSQNPPSGSFNEGVCFHVPVRGPPNTWAYCTFCTDRTDRSDNSGPNERTSRTRLGQPAVIRGKHITTQTGKRGNIHKAVGPRACDETAFPPVHLERHLEVGLSSRSRQTSHASKLESGGDKGRRPTARHTPSPRQALARCGRSCPRSVQQATAASSRASQDWGEGTRCMSPRMPIRYPVREAGREGWLMLRCVPPVDHLTPTAHGCTSRTLVL